MSNVGFRQVGEFLPKRRVIRTPKNPADRATIVSVYPKEIIEVKETMMPREFRIPAGTYDKPSVTTIVPSSWVRDVAHDQPLIEIPVNALQIATSIITDYCNGLLGCDMNSNMPGMFYIPGEVSFLDVTTKYKKKLEEAKAKQKNWYAILVKLGDSLWARSNNNPLVIWDEMRLAARELSLEKAWLRDFQTVMKVNCFACGGLKDPAYPVCPTCRAIDPNHPAAKEIKFAAQ